MPPWSLDELMAALPLFEDVPPARLAELYAVWGGTIRWTLQNANDPTNLSELERAVDLSSLDDVLQAGGAKGSTPQVGAHPPMCRTSALHSVVLGGGCCTAAASLW